MAGREIYSIMQEIQAVKRRIREIREEEIMLEGKLAELHEEETTSILEKIREGK